MSAGGVRHKSQEARAGPALGDRDRNEPRAIMAEPPLQGVERKTELTRERSPCDQYGSCEWCDSGTRCYMPGGDPDACDGWDNGPFPCDWTGSFCSGSGGVGVVCECVPCIGG